MTHDAPAAPVQPTPLPWPRDPADRLRGCPPDRRDAAVRTVRANAAEHLERLVDSAQPAGFGAGETIVAPANGVPTASVLPAPGPGDRPRQRRPGRRRFRIRARRPVPDRRRHGGACGHQPLQPRTTRWSACACRWRNYTLVAALSPPLSEFLQGRVRRQLELSRQAHAGQPRHAGAGRTIAGNAAGRIAAQDADQRVAADAAVRGAGDDARAQDRLHAGGRRSPGGARHPDAARHPGAGRAGAPAAGVTDRPGDVAARSAA